MVLVKATIRISGNKETYSLTALVDTGARMTLIDSSLAERIGVQYTGRKINFISVSEHVVKALEALVLELEVGGEILKYEAVAVASIPEKVKEALRGSGIDENVIIGLLTIERASMMPDTLTGTLRRVESFIL